MANTLTLSAAKTAQALSLNSFPAKRPIGVERHNERFAQSGSRSPAPNGKIHYLAEIERYSRLPTSAADTSVFELADLILIRGLPGSGKSTIARSLRLGGYLHFEADMYFEVDGKYVYDASRIRDAHQWCQHSVREALRMNVKVVVSNTFTRLQELMPYFQMTDKIRIVEATGSWKNQHDVPIERIRDMSARWEQIEPSTKISSSVIH
jgi:hypothetical protein